MNNEQSKLVNKLNLGRIIAPLDGSHSSESALPYAVQLARWTDAEINLLHVIRGVRAIESRNINVIYQDRYHDRGVHLATAYVSEIAQKMQEHYPKVRWGVTTGDTAPMIVARAVIATAGLIIMKYSKRQAGERITETTFDHLWRITPAPILAIDANQTRIMEADGYGVAPKRLVLCASGDLVIDCVLEYLVMIASFAKTPVDIVYPLKNVGALSVTRTARPPIRADELDKAIIKLEKMGLDVSVIFSPEPLQTVQAIHKRNPTSWCITASLMRARLSRTVVKSFAYSLLSKTNMPTLVVPFKHTAAKRARLLNRRPKPLRSITKI